MKLWPFGLYLILVIALTAAMLAVSYILGQRHSERATGDPYEGGIVSEGSAHVRFALKFYLVAMFFVIFDVEADRTTSIMMSRAIVQACELTGDMLERLAVLMDGLQVFPDRMRENLDLSGGLIMAEALMLELGRQIGRQRAHDAVYEAAQGSVTQSRPFREMLALDPHVSAGLTPSQMEALLDPARYTGLCRELAERGAALGREIAATIARRPAARAT